MTDVVNIVNLLGNDIFEEYDIVNRTESMIKSVFSDSDVTILNRKVMAQNMGVYTLTPTELQQLQQYQVVCFAAGQAAEKARADVLLLKQTIEYENALQCLSLDPIPGDTDNYLERSNASVIVSAATQEVKDLAELRKPEPIVEPIAFIERLPEEILPVMEEPTEVDPLIENPIEIPIEPTQVYPEQPVPPVEEQTEEEVVVQEEVQPPVEEPVVEPPVEETVLEEEVTVEEFVNIPPPETEFFETAPVVEPEPNPVLPEDPPPEEPVVPEV